MSLPFLYVAFTIMRVLLSVSAPGYVAVNMLNVKSASAGVVTGIFVRPGDVVRQGVKIIDVVDLKAQARLRALDTKLAEAHAYQTLWLHDQDAASSAREHFIIVASRRLESERRALALTRDLIARNAAIEADAREAQTRVDAAEAAYFQARIESAQAEHVQPFSPSSDIPADEAERKTLERAMQLGITRAPAAGQAAAIYVLPGEYVPADHLLMKLALRGPTRILAYLDPAHANVASVGDKAWLHFPGRFVTTAHVAAISRIAQPPPSLFTNSSDAPLAAMSATFGIGSEDTIELTLTPDQPLSDERSINGLPLEVRFRRTPFFPF
jgi:multidrug resistance efflux pump